MSCTRRYRDGRETRQDHLLRRASQTCPRHDVSLWQAQRSYGRGKAYLHLLVPFSLHGDDYLVSAVATIGRHDALGLVQLLPFLVVGDIVQLVFLIRVEFRVRSQAGSAPMSGSRSKRASSASISESLQDSEKLSKSSSSSSALRAMALLDAFEGPDRDSFGAGFGAFAGWIEGTKLRRCMTRWAEHSIGTLRTEAVGIEAISH
jgi:hypothetical protein